MYLTFALLVSLVASHAHVAQVPVTRTLSGVVLDQSTRAPILAAVVKAGDLTASSGADGRFTMKLPAAIVAVDVSAPKYFATAIRVDLTERDVTDVEFALVPNAGFASSVDVVAAAPSSSPAATVVTPADVLRTPGSLDNIFHTLQVLPGVSAAEEFGSRLAVRGGAPDQNLTVMDGVEMHDPYRLYGLTSAFNPDTIRRFELATGGFSAKYGDRLSSLLLVENRDGVSDRRLGGSGALSLTDANIVLEGGWPARAKGSWLLSARRTYYDLVAKPITNQDFPQFGDVQTKGVWDLGAGRTLSAFGLHSRQSAALNLKQASASGEFNDNTKNDLGWLRFDTGLGRRGRASTVAGYSNTVSDLGVDASVQNQALRSNAPDVTFGSSSVTFSRRLAVRDASARQELTFSFGPHTLEGGAEVHDLTTALALTITGDRNPAAANGSSVQGGAGLPGTVDERRPSTRAGAWLVDTWRFGSRASLEGGLRLDRTNVNHQSTVSPRLSGVFTLTPRTIVKGAVGLYRQSPGYEKLAQSDYLLDFTSSATHTLQSEQASLVSAGLEHTTRRGLTARVEGYYKHFSQLLVGALEDEPTRLARVAQYDFPAEFASSVPTDPIITSTPTNDGAGRAYGFDLFVSRLASSSRLHGWASYTWGKADRQAYGRTYPFEYDRRHAVSAVVAFRLARRWELASTTRWATGFARSVPIGLRVAATPDVTDVNHNGNVTELVPARDADGRLIYTVDFGGVANLNRGRLPDFARVDLRLTWKSAGRWEIYIEVINALNRKNASTLTPKLAYDPASDRPKILQVPDQGFPFLPTFGLRCRF